MSGTTPPERSSTLIFLCVANSARSQMAEGLARATAPPGWEIHSAGSAPTVVNPLAIEAMRELDIDIADHRSKGMEAVPLDDADFIVTLCEDEVCPVAPGQAELVDWAMPDPVGAGDQIRFQMEAFRGTRDEIKRRLETFWRERSS